MKSLSLSLGRKRTVTFFVWDSREEVQKAWNKSESAILSDGQKSLANGEVIAFCDYVNGNAELHFWKPELDASIFVHELTHLILDEGTFRNTVSDEILPRLAERLTRRFWKWYWKEFA